MDAHKLSRRLLAVAEYVPAGARLADIGSDHAYLPAYLALNDKISYAVAGEVVQGPFENAEHEIKKEGLTEIIKPRLADGLAAINPDDKIDTITICGMGGSLIRDILEAGKAKLEDHPFLILQPNVGAENVRRWLMNNHYQIEDEQIISEDGHVYEIIVAGFAAEQVSLSQNELIFGPVLLQHKNAAFIQKWEGELKKLENIIPHLKEAKKPQVEKIQEIEGQIKLIKEEISK